jgi:hypothetical protein
MEFFARSALLIGMVSLFGSPVLAQAPVAVRGKSVTATWTEVRVQRLGGMGDFSERSVAHSLSAYISTEGRVFSRRTSWGGGRRSKAGSVSSVGETTQSGGGNQSGGFRGRSLIITNKFGGGVRMARIDFDSTFTNCTTTVILGRESGKIARGRSLVSGQSLEIKSSTVSNTSCSVKTGNVFGD